MSARILNRDFTHPTDGWYMIEPKGEHANRAAGVVQVIDDEAAQAIVNRFNAEAADHNFAGMLIDHEHFKHDLSKETRAFGWLMGLQNRADGIYGQVRWTATGKAAVDGGDYRFFSTEYDPGETVDVPVLNTYGHKRVTPQSRDKVTRVRPLRLDGLTLTNNPNNKGGKPITNRREEFRQGAGAPPAGKQNEPKQNTKMKTVCTLLGLSEDAQEANVHSAVSRLLNRADVTPTVLQQLQDENKLLKENNKVLLDAQIDSDLEVYKNRYAPAQRDHVKQMLITNRAATVEFLKSAPVVDGNSNTNAPRTILNRESGRNPGEQQTQGGETPEQLAAKAESEIQTYKITNRCSYEQASRHVMLTKPELFPSRN